jgi:pimeloyl-ACP methyl ester carboxylesterase
MIAAATRGVLAEAKPTGPAMQADDAAGLLSTLSLAPAAVYGNSSGAIIALDLVLRHPACKQRSCMSRR